MAYVRVIILPDGPTIRVGITSRKTWNMINIALGQNMSI